MYKIGTLKIIINNNNINNSIINYLYKYYIYTIYNYIIVATFSTLPLIWM